MDFGTIDAWGWLLVAGVMVYLAFAVLSKFAEASIRFVLAGILAFLAYWQPDFWWLGVLGLAQALLLLFIHWRVIYGHDHLQNWIRLGVFTPALRTHFERLWLQWRGLRQLPLPEHPLRGDIQHLLHNASMQSLRENLQPASSLDTLTSLLSPDPAETYAASRKLKLDSGYWVGRAMFLQGQQTQDNVNLQLGAQRMLSSLNVREDLFAWKLLDAEALLSPYGLNLREAFLARTQNTPATFALLGIIGLFFLWELEAGALNSPSALYDLGGNLRSQTLQSGEYWRLVTSIFLHGSWLHVGLNSFYLLQMGREVERKIGPSALIFAFVLSGVVGSVFSSLLGTGNAVSIGASGGLFGLVALEYTLTRGNLQQRLRKLQANLGSLLTMFLIGFLIPNIDNWAHLGGLVTGLLLGLSYRAPSRTEQAMMGLISTGIIAWGVISLLMSR
ncbi:rhomboid family intramembrane serine protease [Deinococcus roseus]|uniref:Peptidase S54 rhomboid domain-containing protein n=1 Tax=Deinococcus roseus TaxID=392414 RepID=A0ABQ2CZE8_9DEIO|nr:rhomboid family intramembrane serine protease [Deinococcus roseus]GGJ34436.1 hypothetical protein GCM10008938_20780 [Deinococcus roseus]